MRTTLTAKTARAMGCASMVDGISLTLNSTPYFAYPRSELQTTRFCATVIQQLKYHTWVAYQPLLFSPVLLACPSPVKPDQSASAIEFNSLHLHYPIRIYDAYPSTYLNPIGKQVRRNERKRDPPHHDITTLNPSYKHPTLRPKTPAKRKYSHPPDFLRTLTE